MEENKNTFRLTEVKVITSKKNNKKYIAYNLLCNNKVVIVCFNEYNDVFEDNLLNSIWEDVTPYVSFMLDKKNASFRPYIKF